MKKIITVTALATSITFGLFTFMAFLISSDQVGVIDLLPVVPIDVAQTPEYSTVEIKPKPPLVPPKPQVMPKSTTVSKVEPSSIDLKAPPIEIKITETLPIVNPMKGLPDRDARPIVRVNPKYPMGAARNGIEGWVILAFDINAVGEVVNIKVIDSAPKRVFDKAAKQALKKWKYRAKSIDGKQVAQHDFTVQLDFNMSQNI